MNSIIRAAKLSRYPIGNLTSVNRFKINQTTVKRWAHNFPLTYDFARERVLLILRLFDKIDPYKLTLDSHFTKDLGIDSLDHVEIVMMLEDEFRFEIPEKDAEKFFTPRDIVRYLTDKEEAYEVLQEMHAHHEHHNDPLGGHGGGHAPQLLGGHSGHELNTSSKKGMCTFTRPSLAIYTGDTSFGGPDKKLVKIEDIQQRVLNVCTKYDKIDSAKLTLESHFVNDLGLDSLDHVEIMMELEDEFGLEIPDQEAEKLMMPVQIARYIYHKEEAREVDHHDDQL